MKRIILDETYPFLVPTQDADGVPTTPDDVTITVYDPAVMDNYGVVSSTLDTGKTLVTISALECNKFRPGREYLIDVTVDVGGNIGTMGESFTIDPNTRFAKQALYTSGGDFGSTDKMLIAGSAPQVISITFESGAVSPSMINIDDGEDPNVSLGFGRYKFKYDNVSTPVDTFITALAKVGIILETNLTGTLGSHVINGQVIEWSHIFGVRAHKYGARGNGIVLHWIGDAGLGAEYLAQNGGHFDIHFDSGTTTWSDVQALLDGTDHLRGLILSLPPPAGVPSYAADPIDDTIDDGDAWTLGGGEWIDDLATVESIKPSYFTSRDDAAKVLGRGLWSNAWRFNMRGGDAQPLWGYDDGAPTTTVTTLIASGFDATSSLEDYEALPAPGNDRDRFVRMPPFYPWKFEAADVDFMDVASGDLVLAAVIHGSSLFIRKSDGATAGWDVACASGVWTAYFYGAGAFTLNASLPAVDGNASHIVMLAVSRNRGKARLAVLSSDGQLGISAESSISGLGSLTSAEKFTVNGGDISFVMVGTGAGNDDAGNLSLNLESSIREMGRRVFGHPGVENSNLVEVLRGAIPTPSVTGVPKVQLESTQAAQLTQAEYGASISEEILFGDVDWDVKVPDKIVVPSTGTRTYRIEISGNSSEFGDAFVDDVMTISVVNQDGVDRSARLDSTTMTDLFDGTFRSVYTASAGDPENEELLFRFQGEVTYNIDPRTVSRWGVAVTDGEGGTGGMLKAPFEHLEAISQDAEPPTVDLFVQSSLINPAELDPLVGETGLASNLDVFIDDGVDDFGTALDPSDYTITEIGDGRYRVKTDPGIGVSVLGGVSLRVVYPRVALAEGYNGATVAEYAWEVRADVGTGDVNVVSFDTGAIDADALAADALAAMAFAVWSQVLEGSHTAGDMVRGIMSNVSAKVSGFLTGVLVFRNLADTLNRWTVTTNADGRASVVPNNLTEPGAP